MFQNRTSWRNLVDSRSIQFSAKFFYADKNIQSSTVFVGHSATLHVDTLDTIASSPPLYLCNFQLLHRLQIRTYLACKVITKQSLHHRRELLFVSDAEHGPRPYPSPLALCDQVTRHRSAPVFSCDVNRRLAVVGSFVDTCPALQEELNYL